MTVKEAIKNMVACGGGSFTSPYGQMVHDSLEFNGKEWVFSYFNRNEEYKEEVINCLDVEPVLNEWAGVWKSHGKSLPATFAFKRDQDERREAR